MVLTTGAVSLLVIPFVSTLSGLLPPPIQESTSPEITSPSIKKDIADPPIVPTVLNLGNGPCCDARKTRHGALFQAYVTCISEPYIVSFNQVLPLEAPAKPVTETKGDMKVPLLY
ncbi:hypothetical protein DSO57_1000174 [Entomophthora muscae]|uniref:Uncharacterized protein n=1 Tax=Entomophthora muscae TaxID=34485 RepID=A0ACC2T918_9FUNG|nr:hypothetical protein DSO57_1000174 [Entomophthora muscae]